ncbi:MAG: hypothetical protein FWE65_01655, partial [Eggerthellaceae bacterium]|nr:hypothetical protein [Eggerthellaceae bacterium]
MEENQSRDNREHSGARKKKNTRSFKHVQLQRERPHLTRGDGAQASGASGGGSGAGSPGASGGQGSQGGQGGQGGQGAKASGAQASQGKPEKK